MPRGQLDALVRFIRRVARDPSAQLATDAQLLERFRTAYDEQAFATLVRRHGRLVRSVCRNVLHHEQDADDAFQVTFLVFATKAASIRKTTAVASWLHGVAYRTAMNAKRERARFRKEMKECTGRTGEQPVSAAALREVQAIVDEELNRLAEKYRAPFVLCCLEGKSRAEAARELGWKEGTISSRLAQARKILQDRLTRRGVALAAALSVIELTRTGASAAVGPALVTRTIETAIACAASPAAASHILVGPIAALADEVLRNMLAKKVVIASTIMLAFAIVAGGGLVARHLALQVEARNAKSSGTQEPQPKSSGMRQATGSKKADAQLNNDLLPAGAVTRLGSLHWHHSKLVRSVFFLPDGKTVLSLCDDGIIHVWDFPSGNELRHFGPGPRNVPDSGLTLSPDGKTLAYHGLWDVETGEKLPVLRDAFLSGQYAVAFAPHRKLVAVLDPEGRIHLWDCALDKKIISWSTPKTKNMAILQVGSALAFSPDGKTLYSIMEGGGPIGAQSPYVIHLSDPISGRHKASIGPIADGMNRPALAISPDSKYLAYVVRKDEGFELVLADASTGKEIRRITDDRKGAQWSRRAIDLLFRADSNTLLARNQNDWTVREWEVASGKLVRDLGKPNPHMAWRIHNGLTTTQLALAPDGKSMIAADSDYAVRVIDLKTGESTDALNFVYPVSFVRFTKDSKHLLTQAFESVLRRWDVTTGKEVSRISPFDGWDSPYTIFSQEGRYFGTPRVMNTDEEGRTWAPIFESATGKELGKVAARELVFSPDGKTLAVGEWHRRSIAIYDLPSLKARLSVPARSVYDGLELVGNLARLVRPWDQYALFFSADGRQLGAFKEQGLLCVWDTATGKQLSLIDVGKTPIFSGAFSPDGRAVALDNSDGTVTLWELASGRQRLVFGSIPPNVQRRLLHPASNATPPTLCFSPDGKLLAHAGLDSTVHVWDVSSGKTAAAFRGHQGAVLCVAFSPDGKRLASGSADTTALIWNVESLSKVGQ